MLAVILVVFVDILGFGIIIPLLPFYGVNFAPAHPFVITMLMATYSGCQLISAPAWGRFSDRVGRKPVMLISLATSVLGYLWLSRASALWMLFAARAVQGISAGNISVAQAYVADVTSPERRAGGMGLLGAAIGLGFTLGPAIGGWLAGADPAHIDAVAPALLAAALSGAAFVLAATTVTESLPPERRGGSSASRFHQIRAAFAQPRLRLLMLVFFTATLAFAGLEATFAQWALARLGWGPRAVGSMFGSIGVLGILMQGGLVGRLARRYGESRLLVFGTIMTLVGLITLAAAHATAGAVVGCCLVALGQGMTSPSIASLVSREATEGSIGGTLGVNQSIGALARLLGPALAGAAFEWQGPGAAFVVGALIMLVSVPLALRAARGSGTAAQDATMAPAEPLAPRRRIG